MLRILKDSLMVVTCRPLVRLCLVNLSQKMFQSGRCVSFSSNLWMLLALSVLTLRSAL